MALTFTNRYALDVGTTFVELYEGPIDPMTYSIITGMTIANKMPNEILIDVRIIDSSNLVTAYLIVDSKLSVGSSLALVGHLQKIILKVGDTIEIRSNEVASVDVVMSIVEDDPSIEWYGPPIPTWYGDFAIITSGETGIDNVSSYIFSSGATVSNIGTLETAYYATNGAGTSNGIIGLFMGGYNAGWKNYCRAFDYATKLWAYDWSTLRLYINSFDACSNTVNYIAIGGYSNSGYYSTADSGDFLSGSVSTFWGNTYNNLQAGQSGALSNDTYALGLGGNLQNGNMYHYEWATQGTANLWGQMGQTQGYVRGGSNQERAILNGGLTYNDSIWTIEFASQSNASFWSYLGSSDAEQGGVSNGLEVLFAAGEYATDQVVDLINIGLASSSVVGLYDFDGGGPVSESGNG